MGPAQPPGPKGQDQGRGGEAKPPGQAVVAVGILCSWCRPSGPAGEGKLPSQTYSPMKTFEVRCDSMRGPVGQEHHGSQVGPC